jgi:hypothetical protein
MHRSSSILGAIAVIAAAVATPASARSPSPSVAVTPPAGPIAFLRWDDALADFKVFTIDADGSDEALLLGGPHEIPRWSPDHASVSMTYGTDTGHVGPALVGADGTGYRELAVEPPLNLGCAAWSPDGVWLGCESWVDDDATQAGIRLVRAADGSDVTRLTEVHDIPGSFSPDGSRIAFIRVTDDQAEGGELWIMDADGSGLRRVTPGRFAGGMFSPDGTSILVDDTQGTLLTVDPDTGETTRIPFDHDGTFGAYWAGWSPDGEWIVFSIVSKREAPDLYVMRRDGLGLTRLTDTPGVSDEAPSWAPVSAR